MENFDPFEIKTAVQQTSIEALEADSIFAKALELATAVQGLYSFVRESPRWEALWDQTARAFSTVALNYAQALGRLRGVTMNDMLCARAELMETFAALSIGPEPFRELKAKAKDLRALLDSRILALPEKSDRPYYRN